MESIPGSDFFPSVYSRSPYVGMIGGNFVFCCMKVPLYHGLVWPLLAVLVDA